MLTNVVYFNYFENKCTFYMYLENSQLYLPVTPFPKYSNSWFNHEIDVHICIYPENHRSVKMLVYICIQVLVICPMLFVQHIPLDDKSTRNMCNCMYDLRHKWFLTNELNEKNISKNITSFSSFVKITKQTISNLEMYSALKLPFSYSYFIVFYYEFFNSKKSFRFIIRKLLRLNYLISYSIVLLPVNKKVELLTMLTR